MKPTTLKSNNRLHERKVIVKVTSGSVHSPLEALQGSSETHALARRWSVAASPSSSAC